jgi:heat-inducible transcriptional repressor
MPRANASQGVNRPTDELDGRRAAILDAVVTEYIETAQPVGSATVARAAKVGVSPATVRAEMVALEREGYLTQPHTSAGRIPTDRGYRFFVDHLAEPGTLGPAQRTQVSAFFDHVRGEMEDVLERTSSLLTDLTSQAAVVVGPSHDTATIRSVQLVGLAARVVLVVVVLDDGAIEKATLELDEDVDDDDIAAASVLLAAAFEHSSLRDVAPGLDGDGPTAVSKLVARGTASLARLAQRPEPDSIFIGGSSKIAGSFEAVETVRDVLAILEQQLVVVSLLNDVLGKGLSVAIGGEHGFAPLASCAVIVAPISVDGAHAGAVGILGPTRMNYPEAMAAAEVVSNRLGERLGSQLHPDADAEDHDRA